MPQWVCTTLYCWYVTVFLPALAVAHKVYYFVIELAFVGKAPGQYAMLLGGGYHGQRLNKIYRG
jgi:hypothetical protein